MIDGVIKYNLHFDKSEPLDKSLWQEIQAIRKKLKNLNLIGEKDGIGYGNISQRVSKTSFVITGTATGHLDELDENHYSFVKEYNDREFFLNSTGACKPSSEALTHGSIYNLNDEIRAVIHVHSKDLWSYMLKNDFLTTNDALYGSIRLIDEVQKIYQNINPLDNPIFVMPSHEDGVIAFGKNLDEALESLLLVYKLSLKNG